MMPIILAPEFVADKIPGEKVGLQNAKRHFLQRHRRPISDGQDGTYTPCRYERRIPTAKLDGSSIRHGEEQRLSERYQTR